jgi:hypothetical protein
MTAALVDLDARHGCRTGVTWGYDAGMVDYDFGDPRRIDRVLALVAEGWRRYPHFRLGQFLEIVAESHDLGTIQDHELEHRLRDPTTWQGPPTVDPI